MRLPRLPGLGRAPAVDLALDPTTRLPTQTLTATVTVPEALDGVTAAGLTLGYVNTYRYRWAGRRDAAAAHDDLSLVTMGQVGTSYGGERETSDWIAVSEHPLDAPGGVLRAGPHAVAIRVPSWAPGSSASTVAWQLRLQIAHAGRDVAVEAPFTVLAPPPAQPLAATVVERVLGDACDIDITVDRPWCRAGTALTGTVSLTPKRDVPTADVAVLLQRLRVSHPLERTPAADVAVDTRVPVSLGKHVQLSAGVTTTLSYAIDVPADADPTCEAVHASITWAVQVRILYAGLLNGEMPERVRRPFVVVTADAPA